MRGWRTILLRHLEENLIRKRGCNDYEIELFGFEISSREQDLSQVGSTNGSVLGTSSQRTSF